MSERSDGDRIIVTGYSGGSHFPRTQAATQYRFEADGLTSEGPFQIDGSVYGKDILLRGPGTITGPVMARGDARLHNHGDAPMRLLAGLHVSGNIGAVSRGGALEESLVASLDRADYVIRGDAIAEHVALENAVVVGNVRGRHVKLTHCIVLGQVVATEAAVLQATTFLSYQAPDVVFEGPCAALFAMGISERAPAFRGYRDGAGKTWPCDMRFYPVFRGSPDSALSNRCWSARSPEYASAALAAADWVRFEASQRHTRVEGGKKEDVEVPVERYAFTVAGRALNFKPVEAQVERMALMLKTALEFNHYHPNDQQAVRRSWDELLTRDEARILRLATDEAPPRAAAATTPNAPSRSVPLRKAAPVQAPARVSAPPAPVAPPRPSPPPAAPALAPASSSATSPADDPAMSRTVSTTVQIPPRAIVQTRRPSKILFVDGAVRGGWLEAFDPDRGIVEFTANTTGSPAREVIPFEHVAAVLVGTSKSVGPRPAVGIAVRVEVAGGRQFTGCCADSLDAPRSLVLVPSDRTGLVDWIWISGAAVRAIHGA